jgi:hypothetical protein
MNSEEIKHYMDTVYAIYDKSVQEKYREWCTQNMTINFDTWAKHYHPRWYEQFGNR